MTIQSQFPALRPTLDLNFANTKQLDPRITFTRASTATAYDGKTVAKAEENLFSYSDQFDNAYWTKTSATVSANSDVAPDGTTTADLITVSNQYGGVLKVVTGLTSGLQYTVSFWAKSGTNTNTLSVWNDVGNVGYGTFTPTATWVRYSFTFTAASSTANLWIAQDRNASGFGSVLIWGAQLEQRSTATAYTPTTTAPITKYIPALQTAAANVARFDHDPVAGESKGLLIEEQRTNLLTYSEQFDNAVSFKYQTLVSANSVIAPDGTQSADKLVEASDTAQTHYIQPSGTTVTAGTNYATTFYLKAGERTKARVVFSTTGGVFADFDLSTGSLIGSVTAFSGGTATSAFITSVGNGWYRCAVIGYGASGTTGSARVEILDASGNRSYNGNGFSGIYIWGAQLEAGSFPTSYIPTVASQVTRSADAASMTGVNFSSWYRADEGTLYGEFAIPAGLTGFPTTVGAISDGTTQNAIAMYAYPYGVMSNIKTGNVVQYDSGVLVAPVVGANVKYTTALAFNNTTSALNGSLGTVDTSVTLPTVTQFRIGAGGAGTATTNTTIKRIAYYPKRLSNTELQGLTS